MTSSSVRTELLNVSFCLSLNIRLSMCWNSKDNVANELVLSSLAVFNMYSSFYLESLIEGRWPCNCFVRCWFQDWLKIARNIYEYLQSSFFSKRFVRTLVMFQYIITDMSTARRWLFQSLFICLCPYSGLNTDIWWSWFYIAISTWRQVLEVDQNNLIYQIDICWFCHLRDSIQEEDRVLSTNIM